VEVQLLLCFYVLWKSAYAKVFCRGLSRKLHIFCEVWWNHIVCDVGLFEFCCYVFAYFGKALLWKSPIFVGVFRVNYKFSVKFGGNTFSVILSVRTNPMRSHAWLDDFEWSCNPNFKFNHSFIRVFDLIHSCVVFSKSSIDVFPRLCVWWFVPSKTSSDSCVRTNLGWCVLKLISNNVYSNSSVIISKDWRLVICLLKITQMKSHIIGLVRIGGYSEIRTKPDICVFELM